MFQKGQLNPTEYQGYFSRYVNLVPENARIDEALSDSIDQLLAAVSKRSEAQLTVGYAAGKWSIKEVIQHLIDSERVFNYRALRFARQDDTILPGFDQDLFAQNSNPNERSIADLIEEFTTVRNSCRWLFKSLSAQQLETSGNANGTILSVRAIAFLNAGHSLHHLKIINEKYD